MKKLSLTLCIAGLGLSMAACTTVNPNDSESYAYRSGGEEVTTTTADRVFKRSQSK